MADNYRRVIATKMFYARIFVLWVLLAANTSCALISECENNDANCTLELVHVLFRHGDRTNDAITTYPNDPYINYTYPPFGIGQLTKRGRQREYRIGKCLREKYNNFLGNECTPGLLDAFTTDTDRTKMSLELVLAGLCPPAHTALEWDSDLNWQPIPYKSVSFRDELMMLSLLYCPNYIKEYNAFVNSPAGLKVQQKYSELCTYLSYYTGMTVNSTSIIWGLYFGFKTEQECGLELPLWTIPVFPEFMEEAAIDQYKLLSATAGLKQRSGGFTLNAIIENMKAKMSGTMTPQDLKMILYSGHEMNVAYLLSAMEVFKPHVPPYGAHVIIELYKTGAIYCVKIFYQDYTAFEPKPLKVPGCQHCCPFEKFIKLLSKNLPKGENVCGDDVSIFDEEKHHRMHFFSY